MELFQEIESALSRHIKSEVNRQVAQQALNLDETIHSQLHDAFYSTEGGGGMSPLENLVDNLIKNALREVDDDGNLTPLCKLIDNRIAHFLKVEVEKPLVTTTPEQVMEMINNRLSQWEDDDFTTEVEYLIERRIDTHEEDKHDSDDIEDAVVRAFNRTPVERELEQRIREMITNDLSFRVTVD